MTAPAPATIPTPAAHLRPDDVVRGQTGWFTVQRVKLSNHVSLHLEPIPHGRDADFIKIVALRADQQLHRRVP